jgi:hypothetical protein
VIFIVYINILSGRWTKSRRQLVLNIQNSVLYAHILVCLIKCWTVVKKSFCYRKCLLTRVFVLLMTLVFITCSRIPLMQHLLISTPDSSTFEENSSRTGSSAIVTPGAYIYTDFVTLSWVIWTLLRTSGYYNGFRRSKDEQTRYCWQEETCNF